MVIDIVAPQLAPALARRLERLTGEDPVCCADDLVGLADEIRARDTFEVVLLAAKALADPSRLTMVAVLAERGQLCGCELQAALGLTHATVSHHVACLEKAGLVASQRRGPWVYYGLTADARERLAEWGL